MQSKTKDDTPDAPAEVPDYPNSFCQGDEMDGSEEVVDGWKYVCNAEAWAWECPSIMGLVSNEDGTDSLYCDDLGIYRSWGPASEVPDFPNSFCMGD